jgi:hypothetical protein
VADHEIFELDFQVEILHGSSPPAIFPSSASAKLTGEFTSLEEPSDDSNITTVLDSLADGAGFAGSERQIEPSDPT